MATGMGRGTYCVARDEAGVVFCLVNVGRYNTVEVAPTDDESQDNTTLIDTFDIIGNPCNGVCNTWVDTKCTEESASITNRRSVASYEHGKSGKQSVWVLHGDNFDLGIE